MPVLSAAGGGDVVKVSAGGVGLTADGVASGTGVLSEIGVGGLRPKKASGLRLMAGVAAGFLVTVGGGSLCHDGLMLPVWR